MPTFGAHTYYLQHEPALEIYTDSNAYIYHCHPRYSKCTRKDIVDLKRCIGFFKAVECTNPEDKAPVTGALVGDEAILERLEKRKSCTIL